MIQLPKVTLVCVDCLNHLGAIKAILKSVEGIKFANVLFLTDKLFYSDKCKSITIDKINSKKEYSYFMMTKLNEFIDTDFCLVIQYDGYVINPELWTDDFLNYDYIGAPWWYNENNVGNGGFSLRSKKLLQTLSEMNIKESDVESYHPEDDLICRKYGNELKEKGFKFAPTLIAKQFSYEPNVKREPFKNHTFGFHGVPNLILR